MPDLTRDDRSQRPSIRRTTLPSRSGGRNCIDGTILSPDQQKAGQTAIEATPSLLEPLETRRMLASISLNAGVLTIEGDSGRQNHSWISKNGSQFTAYLHDVSRSFNADDVNEIRFEGGDKADSLYAPDSLTTNIVARGYGGNDTLHGGGGNDSLYGGDSNDHLVGNRSDDRLDGGNGTDTLDGGYGSDLGRNGESLRSIEGNWGSSDSNNDAPSNPSTGTQEPYGSSPSSLPGRVESEHFDRGGEGVAYHDSDSQNSGANSRGNFRSEGVDTLIQSSGGIIVGWTQSGEWLEYTVNVTEAGQYDLLVRAANGTDGGRMKFKIDGKELVVSLRNQGWSSYSTYQAGQVQLSAGTHVLRVAFDSTINRDAGNLDWFEFKKVSGDTGGTDSGGDTGGSTGGDTGGNTGGDSGDTGGTPSIPDQNAVAKPVAQISVVDRLNIMAGSSVHLHALNSSWGVGSADTARIEWDFGDPNGRYNKIVGFNAGHLYENPGTYTVRLKIYNEQRGYDDATVTVNVSPDTRQRIYVAPWGNDSNTGLSTGSPLRTLKRATERLEQVGNNTAILLQRGGTYDVNQLLYLDRNNVVLGAYGSGAKPKVMWTNDRYSGNNKTVIWFDTDRYGLTVRDIEFDTYYDNDTNSGGLPSTLQPSGKSIAVVDNTFRDVGDAITGSGVPHGILVMGNDVPDVTDLRRYFTWIEGSDWTIVGNDVPNSTREHVIRVGNGSRINIGDNDFANLDRRPQGDSGDYAKGVLNIQKGSYSYAWGNRIEGPTGVGPLGDADGYGDSGARFKHAIFEGNNISSGSFVVEHGAENVHFRSNVMRADNATAMNIEGYDSSYGRGTKNINIVNNTIINTHDIGSFGRIWSGSENVVVSNNLYVAPNLHVGPYGTVVLRVDASNLNGFSRIEDNVWADARINPWASGPMWIGWGSDPSAFRTEEEWNAYSQVHDDKFSNTSIDSNYRPGGNSTAATTGSDVKGVLVDYHGRWRDTSGARAVGAVEV